MLKTNAFLDALGARYEFQTTEQVQRMIEEDTVDGHLPIGKRGEKEAGQVRETKYMNKHKF